MSDPNRPAASRFDRRLDELTPRERAVADTAFTAAASTFADFKDQPESHYYATDGSSPTETWHAITVETARVTAIAAVEAHEGGTLDAKDIEALHRAIFGPVFASQTLALRRFRENVTYGVVRGPRDNPDFSRSQQGISAKSLNKRLKRISADLDAAFRSRDSAVAHGQPRRVLDATLPAARAYCSFLSAHPFVDGNGRTAFPLLNFALIRLGLVAIAVPESDDFHWCLGRGMQRNGHNDFEPMAQYLSDLIRKSHHHGARDAARL